MGLWEGGGGGGGGWRESGEREGRTGEKERGSGSFCVRNKHRVLDIMSEKLIISYESPDLIMHTQSLKFIFSNTFGYDTLTVNGCFEEGGEGSFVRSTKTLAIENLNNMGVYLKPSIVFRLDLIIFFMKLISRVAKKLK